MKINLFSFSHAKCSGSIRKLVCCADGVRKISPLQGDGNHHILAFLYDLLLVKKIKFLTVGRNVILIYTSEIPRQGTMDAYGRFN